MPLVIITGFPGVGKTTWAKKVQKYLEENGQKIVLHNEESLGIKKSTYGDINGDKSISSTILSVAKRDLSRSQTVILDFQNYNSGLRYQLWCEAKQMATATATIYVTPTGPMPTADNPWLKLMIMRYEEPKAEKRWEQPLFCVDIETTDDEFDMNQLKMALLSNTKPNKSVSNSTIPSTVPPNEIFSKVLTAVSQNEPSVTVGTFVIQIPPNTVPMTITRLKRTLANSPVASLPALIQSHLNNNN